MKRKRTKKKRQWIELKSMEMKMTMHRVVKWTIVKTKKIVQREMKKEVMRAVR